MTLGDAFTAVSLLLAAAALLYSRRQTIHNSQVAVLLSLGADYRESWRARWRTIPSALVSASGRHESLSPEEFENLVDALNWLDWFGVACREGVIPDPGFIIKTVGPSMAAIIRGGQDILAQDRATHGADFWSGIDYVGDLLHAHHVIGRSAAWEAAEP